MQKEESFLITVQEFLKELNSVRKERDELIVLLLKVSQTMWQDQVSPEGKELLNDFKLKYNELF